VQVERLERRLAEYPNAFLLVSHDRAFLRATCDVILEVERRGVTRWTGGYDAWRRQRAERQRKALQEYVRQHEKIEKVEDFIRRNIAGQKTKQAQSRRRMLERMEKLDRPEDVWEAAHHLGIEFEAHEHPGGREAIRARDVTVGFPGKEPLVTGFDWVLHRGERVGIVGPNGAGKTSLVRALLGRLRPLGGYAELGYQVDVGYLDQKLAAGLESSRSLVDEVRSLRPDLTIEGARDALGRYRFMGDEVFKSVNGLSGGERCRVALLKVSLKPHNLLVFDEPTNHLDIPAREVLERALKSYEGTLLVISHDRAFLDEVVEKILWVENGEVRVFEGNWSEARRKMRGSPDGADGVGDGENGGGAVVAATPSETPPREKEGEAEERPQGTPKSRSAHRETAKRRRRERTKARSRLPVLEEEIARFEARAKELEGLLVEDPGGDWERVNRLANEEQELRARLERRYAEWERVTEILEREE
jgi:ATP-binding cassette subfamily F protein 3